MYVQLKEGQGKVPVSFIVLLGIHIKSGTLAVPRKPYRTKQPKIIVNSKAWSIMNIILLHS